MDGVWPQQVLIISVGDPETITSETHKGIRESNLHTSVYVSKGTLPTCKWAHPQTNE